jgi:hypothetical protein
VFGVLMALYGLIVYPIMRADRSYNDDLKRALLGRAGWDSNGRPLTTLLMRALQCYDHAMVDISPLTQVGAVALLAWCGVLMARRFAIGAPWLAALVAFPLGGQPFFLENLSYKFDALSMGLAMLLALLPVIQLRPDRRGRLLGVLALFGSLCLYQPAINAYLVFVLLDLMLAQLAWEPWPRLLRRAGAWLAQATVAMVVYELLVGMHIHGWVGRQIQPVHGEGAPVQVAHDAMAFYAFIGAGFNAHWWMYFGPLLGLLGLLPVVVGVRYALAQDGLLARGLLCTVGVLATPLSLLAALGPMLVLRRPEIAPRVLIGLGALLSAALVVALAALRQWRRSGRWVVAAGGMLALGMAVVASAYGNAMAAQQVYERHIAARLADDVAALRAHRPVGRLVVDGSAGLAPLSAHAASQLPLIDVLVPRYLTQADSFATRGFLAGYLPDLVDPVHADTPAMAARDAASVAATCHAVPVVVTAAYRLYLSGDVAVVRFRAKPSDACAAPVAR